MYTKELGSYSTKTSESQKTKELGSKKNIKIFLKKLCLYSFFIYLCKIKLNSKFKTL